jgi:hypothetical protein
MPHPGAPALLLRVGDHERLTGLLRSGSVRSGLAKRAGLCCWPRRVCGNAEIAETAGGITSER